MSSVPPPPLQLARATNRHLARIRSLHFAGLVDSGSLALDPALDGDLVDVEAAYADGLFLVASRADAPELIIGMGAIRRIDGAWHLKRMRVDAAHRRRGIAQAVLHRLVAEARARGAAALLLDTAVRQEAAQRLYERNGFVHVGDALIGGLPSRLYRLALRADGS
jgi:ribosomal protein S18 acetylase RimI-like enzyme